MPTIPKPVECTDVQTLLAYEAGRHDAFHEAADLLKMSPQTIRLHAGEMTAQEMRTVQAVLRWKTDAIRSKADVGTPVREPNVDEWFANICTSTLGVTHLQYRVLTEIVELSYDKGWCNASLEYLADVTGSTKHRVGKATKGLADLGLFDIKPGIGRGNTTEYRLCLNRSFITKKEHVDAVNAKREASK